MPPCYCQHNRCNGTNVGLPTFKAHERHDRVQLLQSAIMSAQETCRRQDDAIASFTSTLGRDHVGEVPTFSYPLLDPYHHSINERLLRLRDIEKKVDALVSETKEHLQRLEQPKHREDIFPLTQSTASVRSLLHELSGVTGRSPAVQVTKSSISDRLSELLYNLKEARKRWNQAAVKLPHDPAPEVVSRGFYNTEKHNTAILTEVDPIIQASIFTMVVLQVVLHLSRRGCHFLLSMLRYIVQLSLQRSDPSLSARNRKLLSDFPKDPDSAIKQFLLEGSEIIYAVCPKATCHKLHPPKISSNFPIPQYPKYCTHCEFDGNECATRLTRPRSFGDVDIQVPIKRFVSFSFKDYVASLTSRPGFEDLMDQESVGRGEREAMHDAYDGEFLQNFKGPDGKPFRSDSGPEGRYAFSLGLDFFNPLTNKQGGKKVSAGVISVICLNLPISLRYKPENMFLAGVIPGPSEPPLTAINHYIAPIMDEYLEFWRPGIWFSQTAKFALGRLIYCILALVVCDLPAARKISGFASHSSEHFCNICHCTLSNPGLQNIDYHEWKTRTDKQYRDAAKLYRAAVTSEAQEEKFRESGVRWSELLRLPYFDMVECVVIDPAHNHFLGLINEHFTNILGIRLRPFQEKKVIQLEFMPTPHDFKESNKNMVERAKNWLRAPYITTFGPTRTHGLKKLMRLTLPVLEFVCEQIRCPLPILPESRTSYTKQECSESIISWREEQLENRETGASSSTPCGHILSADEMAQIWTDIEQMITPTWMTSVPSKLGQPHHGKLKADQWRALGTTHLSASLIRLWATGPMNDERSQRCYDILHVTLSLISAIILATSRTITRGTADAYLRHMLDYLAGIRRLFPDYKLVPNQHLALHIHRYLLAFGPVHSWWTFPYERLIGTLQRAPNNGKLGDIEDTMARTYTRRGNIQTLLGKANCPEVIQHSSPFFESLLAVQLRDELRTTLPGFRAHDDYRYLGPASRDERALPAELRFAFLRAKIEVPLRGALPSRLGIDGLTFATSSKHPGNSCVMVTPAGSSEVPAQLVYIVRFHEGSKAMKTYLGVRRHQAAAICHDPYLCFPVLRARIWDANLHELEIIEPSQIACHFACLPLILEGRELVVVLPLSKNILFEPHSTPLE